jgi:MerR family mercuric resistance operon transcriptional regulator
VDVSSQYSIGQLAMAGGVKLETIRYYERIGLMTPPPRTTGGHRAYGEGHLQRLAFIRRGRELHFGLQDIRELLLIADQSGPVCGAVRKVAEPHLGTVRRRIGELQRFEAMLAEALDGCTGSLAAPDCPVLGILAKDTEAA